MWNNVIFLTSQTL